MEEISYKPTFAKYLQTLSTVLARSWLKGQELPAWHAPCLKNLHGTCDVSIQELISIKIWVTECRILTLLSWRASRAIESCRRGHMCRLAVHRSVQSSRRDVQRASTHVSEFLVARHSVGRAGVAQHCALYRCRDRGAEVGVLLSRVSCACSCENNESLRVVVESYRRRIGFTWKG